MYNQTIFKTFILAGIILFFSCDKDNNLSDVDTCAGEVVSLSIDKEIEIPVSCYVQQKQDNDLFVIYQGHERNDIRQNHIMVMNKSDHLVKDIPFTGSMSEFVLVDDKIYFYVYGERILQSIDLLTGSVSALPVEINNNYFSFKQIFHFENTLYFLFANKSGNKFNVISYHIPTGQVKEVISVFDIKNTKIDAWGSAFMKMYRNGSGELCFWFIYANREVYHEHVVYSYNLDQQKEEYVFIIDQISPSSNSQVNVDEDQPYFVLSTISLESRLSVKYVINCLTGEVNKYSDKHLIKLPYVISPEGSITDLRTKNIIRNFNIPVRGNADWLDYDVAGNQMIYKHRSMILFLDLSTNCLVKQVATSYHAILDFDKKVLYDYDYGDTGSSDIIRVVSF
jgi:hypothetical protein